MSEPLLQLSHISKRFSGVIALDDVQLTVDAGTVHVLLGENGAGKSTLMKVVTGAVQRDGGVMRYLGRDLEVRTPRQALDAGISMVYQEISLAPHLTVAENICLGNEPLSFRRGGLISRKQELARAEAALQRFHLDIDPSAPVQRLSVAQSQMVEIVKAFSADTRLIILDEPTAAMTSREIEELFRLIRTMKRDGIAFIYISHRLEELPEIGDVVTVLRDGRYVDTVPADTPVDTLIRLMIGRTVEHLFPKRDVEIAGTLLEVRGLTRKGVFSDISFTLRKGEILGLAGLVGAGRTEMARALFGADPVDAGSVILEQQPVRLSGPRQALESGIAYLSEDRKNLSLASGMTVRDNITLAHLRKLSGRFFLNEPMENDCAEQYRQALDIRMAGLQQPVQLLSGGNQQKVVLARLLATSPRVLIFDEPTRGVDVGAKVEIYRLMTELVDRGAGILMISSYLPEILALSDRVLVMRGGRIAAEFDRREATQERIIAAAAGAA